MCLNVLCMKFSSFGGLVRMDPSKAQAELRRAGEMSGWEMKYAAGYLGVSRATLYRLMGEDRSLKRAWDEGRDEAIAEEWK